jgi:hypothetical protein
MVPMTDVAAWRGAGSTFVTKWYDQSGNARDHAMATASFQPAFGTLALGVPGMTFDGVDDLLVSAHWGETFQPLTQHFVYRRVTTVAGGANPGVVSDCLGSQLRMAFYMRNSAPNSESTAYAGGAGIVSSDVDTSHKIGSWGAVSAIFNGTGSRIDVNANTIASFDGGGIDLGSGHIGPATNFDAVSLPTIDAARAAIATIDAAMDFPEAARDVTNTWSVPLATADGKWAVSVPEDRFMPGVLDFTIGTPTWPSFTAP